MRWSKQGSTGHSVAVRCIERIVSQCCIKVIEYGERSKSPGRRRNGPQLSNAPSAAPVHFVFSETHMAPTATDLKLIDAINILAEYAETHLPAGYEIELRFGKDDAGINVVDPEGDVIDVDPDGAIATFRLACQEACDDARRVIDPYR